jgi:methyl-accepting chemotaxis protein
MDPTTILAIAIVGLSAVLIVVGSYTVILLRDLRRAIGTLNKILGRVDSMTEHFDTNILRPASGLAGLLAVIRDGARVVSEIKHLSGDVAETAKVVNEEVHQASQAVKEDLVPAVTAGAEEVASAMKEQAVEAVAEVAETVHNGSAPEPEPLKAGSLSSTRRRFYSRKR